MSKQLIAIFCTVLACAFMVGACGDETTVTVAASKDLSAAVLKDHDTLVVPSGGTDYDLKPFLASLHGVAVAKVRMSQSEAGVEFDAEDCPNDATETYELEYQVNAKDHTLDIECADSAEDLPEKVAKGLLALSDEKIYMYELDDNDGDDDEVEINTGDMLFFLIDSDDLDKTKKLGKQAVRFTGEDEDTESEDVGAVLAFGGEDVTVKSTDDGGAATGDGYLFVAVHWGGDDDADEAFGLGEDEEDNITKPASGNNNDDNDDDDNSDNNDDNDDGDDGDDTPSEVCGEKAAPAGLDDDDACACTESGATKKGVVAAGKCTLSEVVCGQKPQTGTNGTSCTCKLAVADATDAAGVIDSGMCVANNVCGTKTHVATDNADCTCKATAGATQEVPGLVASNECHNKADVCGHKTATGTVGASCTCKATVTATQDTAGFVDSNDVCQVSTLAQGPALAAPFAEAKVKPGTAVGSLVFTWECDDAAANSMYHLASNAGELDSCDEVSVEATPNLERKLAGVHILRKPVTHGAMWAKAGYVAAASVTKSDDTFTYTLTGVDTGYSYTYALAPAKAEDDLSWKDHLSVVMPVTTAPSGTYKLLACNQYTAHRTYNSPKLFTVDKDNKAINLCPDATERCGRKKVTADDGTACECKFRTTSTHFTDGLVLNNLCTNKAGLEARRATKVPVVTSLDASVRDNPIGFAKYARLYIFNPPYTSDDQIRREYTHCQKTGNVGDAPSGDVQGDDWCTGTGEEKVTWSSSVPHKVAENVRHYTRLRIHAKDKTKGEDGYWVTPWIVDPNEHTRLWGFTDKADELHSYHANVQVLYGGKGNDYLYDSNNAATELTYLIDGFSWDRLGGLEKRLSLTGKTSKIKCEDSSKTLKMVVLSATTFAEAAVSKKVTPSTCPVSGTKLDDRCFGVRLTVDSNNTLTALSGTGDTAVSGTPDKHLFFKCE